MPSRCARACATPGCRGFAEVRGRCPECASRAEQARAEEAGRIWYNTSRWRRLRVEVLEAADYMCQCEACALEGRATAANTVDHRIPHRGDPRLFWDRANLQAMSAECHSAKTAREINERGRNV